VGPRGGVGAPRPPPLLSRLYASEAPGEMPTRPSCGARQRFFKQFMGTDEITLPVYVSAMFDYHWNDHAGQIAEIRKANGMPDA
jgi:hypothetical protein